ncbi:MAG: aldo/keto reductase [Candidatus Aminicenantaceae bacterium]
MKRREFIGKSALGLFTTGFGLPFLKAKSFSENSANKIVYRTLGRTNLRIPVVSFGVMNTDSPDLIKRALDRGIKHFDTAHVYLRGNSERVIGEVVEKAGVRDKLIIATKMYFAKDQKNKVFSKEAGGRAPLATAENLNRQLELSLERLRTDYVDILYLHNCESPAMVTYEPMLNAFSKVKKQGKTRFIGVSFHTDEPNNIRAAVDSKVYDVILTTYNFAQEHREEVKKAIQYAAKNNVGVIAMKTQGGRRLQERGEIEVNHRAALKWVLEDENVCTTIPGMTTFYQLDLNLGVMNDMALSKSENIELELASNRKGKLFCQNCRDCIETCPQKVEIPELIRSYMYAKGYGNYIQARDTIAELPDKYGLKECLNCSQCTASCRTGINIPSRINTLLEEKLYLA